MYLPVRHDSMRKPISRLGTFGFVYPFYPRFRAQWSWYLLSPPTRFNGEYRCSDSGSRTHLRTCSPLCRGYRRLPLNLSGELNPPRPSRRIASDAIPCVHAGSLSLCVVIPPTSRRWFLSNPIADVHPSPQRSQTSWRTIGGTASPHPRSIHTSDCAW